MSEQYVGCAVRELPRRCRAEVFSPSAPASAAAGRTVLARRVCGHRRGRVRGHGRTEHTPACDTARKSVGPGHARSTRCSNRGPSPFVRTHRVRNTSGAWSVPRVPPGRFRRHGTSGKARRPQGAGSSRGGGPAGGKLCRSGNTPKVGSSARRAPRYTPGSWQRLWGWPPRGKPNCTPWSRSTCPSGGGVCWGAGASRPRNGDRGRLGRCVGTWRDLPAAWKRKGGNGSVLGFPHN